MANAEPRLLAKRLIEGAESSPHLDAKIEGVSIEALSATVFGPARLSVDGEDRDNPLDAVKYRVDRGPWQPLRQQDQAWVTELPTQQLVEGPHTLEVTGIRTDGLEERAAGAFRVDRRVR